MDNNKKGKVGEDAVCNLLIKHGHEILRRNYRKSCGEIDIISRSGDYIVFTEVKARKPRSLVRAVDAVTRRKKINIVITADHYISETKCTLQPRYDIAEVLIVGGATPMAVGINIFEDAFSADDIYTEN